MKRQKKLKKTSKQSNSQTRLSSSKQLVIEPARPRGTGGDGVDISPGVGVYAMFPSFNYKPWLALGEFLDNSVSSFEANRARLVEQHGHNFKLRLMMDYDAVRDQLVIRDNACGIDTERFAGAFALARPPEDLRYISRYGVGMKAAACWFAREWSVRTTAVGENVERTLSWVTKDIVDGSVTEIHPRVKHVAESDHYTVITLKKLIHPPTGPKTVAKIKQFIPNIYRQFMKDGEVEIFWNGEQLKVEEYEVLVAPPQGRLDQPEQTWDEEVVLKMSDGRTITGRVFLLKKMKRTYTALNLFWHNRLILGNIEPNHRPWELFSAGNSFKSGRLCVDLHLDEYEPTIDKMGFKFQDNERQLEDIIEELKRAHREILRQAEDYRVPQFDPEAPLPDIGPVVTIPGGEIVATPAEPTPDSPYPRPVSTSPEETPKVRDLTKVLITDAGVTWEIILRQGMGPGDNEFVRIEEIPMDEAGKPHCLVVTLGGQHPFVLNSWTDDPAVQRLLLLFGSAVGFGEIAARQAGQKYASFVRNNIDRFLRLVVLNEHRDNGNSDE